MAEITIRVCDRCDRAEDDLPEPAKTVEYEHDGVRYAVDLCPGHQREWRLTWDAFQVYVHASRRLTPEPVPEPEPEPAPKRRRQQRYASAKERARGEQNARIRAWAIDNGFPAPDRGRINDATRSAYFAAHPDEVETETTHRRRNAAPVPEPAGGLRPPAQPSAGSASETSTGEATQAPSTTSPVEPDEEPEEEPAYQPLRAVPYPSPVAQVAAASGFRPGASRERL